MVVCRLTVGPGARGQLHTTDVHGRGSNCRHSCTALLADAIRTKWVRSLRDLPYRHEGPLGYRCTHGSRFVHFCTRPFVTSAPVRVPRDPDRIAGLSSGPKTSILVEGESRLLQRLGGRWATAGPGSATWCRGPGKVERHKIWSAAAPLGHPSVASGGASAAAEGCGV